MVKKWSDEETLSLIELYRDRPNLWDSSHRDYKEKNKRHDGFMEIAVSFGVDKDEVERKIKNLTSHFWRERKKEKDSKKTGSGSDEVYLSKWFAMPTFTFLLDKNNVRKTVDTAVAMEGQLDSQKKGVENAAKEMASSNLAQTPPGPARKKSLFVSPRRPTSAKRKLPSQMAGMANPVMKEAVDLMKSINSNRRDKDEFDLFGEQVAIKLRRIKSPYGQFTVQNKINTTLYEGELGIYDTQMPNVSFDTSTYNLPFHPSPIQPPPHVSYQSHYQVSPSPSPSNCSATTFRSAESFVEDSSQQQNYDHDMNNTIPL